MNRFLCILLLLAACGDTGQASVTYPLYVSGASATTFDVGGWSISLTRADVAFGPLYFCASSGASSDLCPQAVGELASDVRIDALSDVPIRVGDIAGVTGEVRSARYDLGISWPITANAPVASESAPDGHSAVLEGVATKGSESFQFVATIDLPPAFAGGHTVAGQRAETFVLGGQTQLTMLVPVEAWLSEIDFDSLSLSAAPSVEIRDGYAPLSDGAIDPRRAARDDLALAIVNLHRIQFEWSTGE